MRASKGKPDVQPGATINNPMVYEATSFGGLHTTAERRARWGGDAIPEGFIRLSAGCEDTEDLLTDLAQALDTATQG